MKELDVNCFLKNDRRGVRRTYFSTVLTVLNKFCPYVHTRNCELMFSLIFSHDRDRIKFKKKLSDRFAYVKDKCER